MKKLTNIISWVAFAGVIAIAVGYVATREKVAYVDNNKVLREYEGVKKAVEEFKQKAQTWQANVDTLERELQQALKTYEQKRARLSAKENQEELQKLEQQRQQFLQYQQVMQQKAAEEDQKVSAVVKQEIDALIKQYAKQQHYTLILGATNSGNLIYAEKGLDITDDIIEWLNDQYNGTK